MKVETYYRTENDYGEILTLKPGDRIKIKTRAGYGSTLKNEIPTTKKAVIVGYLSWIDDDFIQLDGDREISKTGLDDNTYAIDIKWVESVEICTRDISGKTCRGDMGMPLYDPDHGIVVKTRDEAYKYVLMIDYNATRPSGPHYDDPFRKEQVTT